MGKFYLGIIGLVAILAGFYFIIFSPSSGISIHDLGGGPVSTHDMFFGQTLAIIGGVFVAIQWRPR